MEAIHVGMPPAAVAAALHELFDRVDRDYAVVLVDAQLNIAWWNAGATHLFGHAPADVLGRPVELIFTPEDRARQAHLHEAAIARAAGRSEDDRWHLRRDGSRFWASGILTALWLDDGSLAGFAKIMRDRTDLRTQTEALRNRTVSDADDWQRRKIMLGTLAHELRNPLAPLANASRLIRMTVDDTRLQYPLQIIDRQISFLERLIDDLLELTRAEAGKLRLQYTSFPMQDAVSEAVESVRPQAQARRQQLAAILPPAPVELCADRDRFLQILVNLLNNAVRYTPPQGRILVKAMVETASLAVRVEDNGQGIAPEMQPRIFDLFTQGVVSPSREGGLGIGLSVVKELVAAHGGTVAVRSEGPGKGSEFTVRLPLVPRATTSDDR